MKMKTTLITSSILATLIDSGAAHATLVTGVMGNYAWTTNHANFTMLNPTGATVGGTNNVNMTWDGNAFTSSSDYAGPGGISNITASSTSAFFNIYWTAHDIQVFVPGSYSFDTSLGGGNTEIGMMNVTVPAGHLGMHMLFDWNGNFNIDVFIVAAPNSLFGTGVVRTAANSDRCDHASNAMTNPINNCLWGGGTVTGYAPTTNQAWMLASVDGNGDGIMGIPMTAGGPFAGFNVNFNANMSLTSDSGWCANGNDICESPVPVPAAAWLFGSGLLGLFGATRRKNKSRS